MCISLTRDTQGWSCLDASDAIRKESKYILTVFLQLRQVLDIKPEQAVILERYSDSAGGYIGLDESNPQAFKTLIRAAKAKLKLRLKATVTPIESEEVGQEKPSQNIMDSVAVRYSGCTLASWRRSS